MRPPKLYRIKSTGRPVQWYHHEAKFFWYESIGGIFCSLCGNLLRNKDACMDHYKEDHSNVFIAWDQDRDILTPFKYTLITHILTPFYKKEFDMSTLKTYHSKTSNKIYRFVPEAKSFWYQSPHDDGFHCSICTYHITQLSEIHSHYYINHGDVLREVNVNNELNKAFKDLYLTDIFTDLDKKAPKDFHLNLNSTDYPHVTKQLILKRKFTSQTVSYIVPKEAETFVIRIGVDFCCTLCLTHYKEPLFDHIQREHPTVYKAFKQANPDAPDIALYALTELFDVVDPLAQKKEYDPVNHPSHYTFGKYEVLPVLMDWFPDQPLLWQVVKYLSRAKHKGAYLQDLKKAEFYLKCLIEDAEKLE